MKVPPSACMAVGNWFFFISGRPCNVDTVGKLFHCMSTLVSNSGFAKYIWLEIDVKSIIISHSCTSILVHRFKVK